jgi:hypothetical protein
LGVLGRRSALVATGKRDQGANDQDDQNTHCARVDPTRAKVKPRDSGVDLDRRQEASRGWRQICAAPARHAISAPINSRKHNNIGAQRPLAMARKLKHVLVEHVLVARAPHGLPHRSRRDDWSFR